MKLLKFLINLLIFAKIYSTKTTRDQTAEAIILVSQKLLEPKIMNNKLNNSIRQRNISKNPST